MSAAVQVMGERIRAASAANAAARSSAGGIEPRLRIRGGGTKDFYGNTPQGEPLDTRGHAGIINYEPTELVITARAGTPLALIETTLAVQQQMLAFEPPHFGSDATLGGCIASGLAGPRRAAHGYSHGAVRDFVLGASLLDGRARQLKFGGTVMKNVAGYDVSRLLAGSMGVLGVILEVSLKVLPKPVSETTRSYEFSETAVLSKLAEWGRRPLPVSATAWHDGVLRVRFAGAAAAVTAAVNELGGEALAAGAAEQYWLSVREQTLPHFVNRGGDVAAVGDDAARAPLWRCSLPLNAAPLQLHGVQLIEWGGALRWLRSGAPAEEIRARVAVLGGHATLFRGGDRSSAVFHPLSPAVAGIHQRLINEFDPHGVFDTGRLLHGAAHASPAR